jgi:hypothetical protein
MIARMSDTSISNHIEALVAEEQALEGRETQDAVDPAKLAADRARLAQVKVELDQAWDLLRQRRALREAGVNPDEAGVRDAGTVEGYIQ